MDTFSIDHISPQGKGGSSDLYNLALACQSCNAFKSTRTEIIDLPTNQITPLYNPRQDEWNQHFTWSEDYTEILGLTPTGRVTINALQLNRDGNRNLRRVLYLCGDHPP